MTGAKKPSNPSSDAASRATIQPPSGPSQRETVLPSTLDSQPAGGVSGGSQLGQEFGRYQILECLGAGAMGTVYKARDSQLDRTVALKIPKFSDPELLERFYREARSAATVTHPNICPVHDVGEIDGTHYISMGYIEGKELSAFIKPGKPQPVKQIVAVIRKLAIALDEAHQTGIVHRDLKPDNVMIDKRATPIIMDFGLALREAPGDARMTQAGSNQLMGTPAYMSPEQVDGDQVKVGPASDVYSLGIMLYEMLTCQLPYQGSVGAVLAQIINANPKPPAQLRPDLDARLESICLKMMAASQQDRYESMREVAKELTAYIKTIGQGSTDSTAAIPPSLPVANQDKRDGKTTQPATASGSSAVVTDPVDDVSFAPLPSIKTTDFNAAKELNHDTTTKPANSSRSKSPPKWAIISGAAVAGVLFWWGVITLFVSTDNQTVKIEIDDPKAQVFVDGQQVTIKNLGADIELLPGPHGYQIRRGDVLVKADSFTVLDGKNEVVRITVLDKKKTEIAKAETTPKRTVKGNPTPKITPEAKRPPSNPDPALSKSEQAAHEWVLATATKTHFEAFPNGRRMSGFTGRAGKFPSGGKITRIEFESDSVLTAETARHLHELKSLKDLHFPNGLTDSGAAHLAGLSLHHVLGLDDKLTNAGVVHFSKLSELRNIHLSGAQISSPALQALSGLSHISRVTLDGCSIDSIGWAALNDLPNLQTLRVYNIELGAKDLGAIIAGCPLLTSLELDGIKLTDDMVAIFEKSSSIKGLSLRDSRLTETGLSTILRMPHLESLELAGTQFTESAISLFKDNTKLKTLKLSETSVTENGLKALATMPNLTVLDFKDCDVTDQGLSAFKSHPRLNLLTLANTQITADAIETLLTLPRLAMFDVTGSQFTRADAAQLRKVKSNVRVIGATAE
jgi:serine/threonine protein kinase/Leucine-rich repeat (LRR) protein